MPEAIRLYNLSINLDSGEEKQYAFNSSFDFLEKRFSKGREYQFALSRVPVDLFPLQAFLGFDIQLDDLFVDTCDFHTDTYWLMIENASKTNLLHFYQVLLDKFQIAQSSFLHWAGYLNSVSLSSLEECIDRNCIACIRVPLQSNRLKIYARPFRYNSFELTDEVKGKMLAAIAPSINSRDGESQETFAQVMHSGGVSYDFSDGRIVAFTQNDGVKILR